MRRRPRALKNIIGPAIQRRRIDLGWSQAKLAAECQMAGWDISRGIVAALESRVRWAGDYETAILARVLGVTVAALFPNHPNWNEVGLAELQFRRKK